MNNLRKHINLGYLDLMSGGDEATRQTILEMLLEELPAEVGEIQSLAAEADLGGLAAVSHKLKSTLAFVGNEAFNQTNQRIERIAKGEADAGELPGLVERLMHCCDLVMPELEEALGGAGSR